MFPLELITMAGSFLMGYLGKVHTMKMEQRQMEIQTMNAVHKIHMEGRELIRGSSIERERFQWTRRFIAITVVLTVLVAPMLASLFGIPIIYGWTEALPGNIFFDGSNLQHFTVMKGVTVLPYASHALSAVLGLYFGKGR